MKQTATLVLLALALTGTAQKRNKDFDRRYFHHWESVNPRQIDMEIIIHKDNGKARVSEFKADHKNLFGQGILYSTVYVCMNRKGRMIVETLDPSTMELVDSEYILTPDDKLLRVTQNDTITFKKRY